MTRGDWREEGSSLVGMGSNEERVALLALLLSKRVSWSKTVGLVLEEGGARQALDSVMPPDDGLFPVEEEPAWQALEKARSVIAQCESMGVRVHSFQEEGYPAQLRDVHEMPPLVFTRGTAAPGERRSIAIVGSRKASQYGLSMAASIARALTEEKITVVSGLAAGVDAAAHRAALDHGGRTVGIIGTGIDRVYPADNRELQQEIADKGMVLSQFLPGAPPTKQSFPMRNAVMSGYAAATIVVEAGEHSGARIQARMALKHGRPVILPQETLVNEWARDYAQRPGVYVVRNLSELVSTVHGVQHDAEVTSDQLWEEGELVW